MKPTEIEEKFGLSPLEIGFMPSDYWLVTEPDAEDREVGAQTGDLCVSTLDGDDVDISVISYTNYIGTVSDPEDPIYCYYYFTPVDCFGNYDNNSTKCKECTVAVECYELVN